MTTNHIVVTMTTHIENRHEFTRITTRSLTTVNYSIFEDIRK